MMMIMIKTHRHPSLSSPPSPQEVSRPCPSCSSSASSSSSRAGFETTPDHEGDDHDDHCDHCDHNGVVFKIAPEGHQLQVGAQRAHILFFVGHQLST